MLNELASFEAQAGVRAFRHSKGHFFSREEMERDRVIAEATRRQRFVVIEPATTKRRYRARHA